MKVVVFTDRLNKALSLVSRIVSHKGQLPVLNNVLLDARDGALFLTTTNLETTITTKIIAVVEKEGKTTVPVKQLFELTTLINEEKINLIYTQNNLTFEGKKIKNTLNTITASEFPQVIKSEEKINLVIESQELKEAVNQTAISTTTDEGRPVLAGEKITIKGEKLEMATTDGYRLTVKNIKTQKAEISESIIIPIKTLIEVVRISDEEKTDIINATLVDKQNQIIFFLKNTEVVSRLIEGNFPNFEKIIPTSHTSRVVVDREDLLNAVKMTAVYARESANIIKINIKGKQMMLSANAPQVGQNQVSIDIEQQGEDTEIAFNYRFLLDFLSIIEQERVVFETSGALNPGVFKLEKSVDFFHIIMPVRVQS